MAKTRSRITAQGQISVPAGVRRTLGVGPGSVLEWTEVGDHVMVRRAGGHTFAEVHGALFPNGDVPKGTNTKEGVRTYIRRKHARN